MEKILYILDTVALTSKRVSPSKEIKSAGKITAELQEAFKLSQETIGKNYLLSNGSEKQRYAINTQVVSIGSKTNDTIVVLQNNAFILQKIEVSWQLEPLKDSLIYINSLPIKNKTLLYPGDIIFYFGLEIIVHEDYFDIVDYTDKYKVNLLPVGATSTFYDDEYPLFHRSPRIILHQPEDEIKIIKPPSEPAKPSEQILKIIAAPLTTLAVTIGINLIQPRGIMMLMGVATTAISTIIATVTYIKNQKQYKIDLSAHQKVYSNYIKEKNAEIYKGIALQKKAIEYHLPTISEIATMSEIVDRRIYEKMVHHPDFLEVRVGLTDTEPSFKINYEFDELASENKDPMIMLADEVRKSYDYVPKLPYGLSLMNGAVGFIGTRSVVIEQLQLIMAQVATFHSYHDVEMVTIFPEQEKSAWEWARWLPHTTLNANNMRGFIYHERSREQVLGSLYQILKMRKQALEESKDMRFTPHYLVFITEEKLMTDHSIMEYIKEDISKLGVTLIYVKEHIESLPEFVHTVIDYRDDKEGTIILENSNYKNAKLVLDHFPKKFNKEQISRALAPLNHILTLVNTIPEAVTFLEMYDVKKIEELDITQRWATHAPHKSLAVPLGLRGKDDIVNLNLHEKAHGPHGLVAGTTGSGKSEIVQSYILSLAINFHPYDVAFLLIDYKGGGMANLFKDLPHHLGSITNLDGAQSMRALISIKAELQRRQRLFSANEVNHINQYQKLYKEGKVTEPMPHLFLISDEFAELKSEQPEFMKELVSTARIGRSLGIHLILATQKPTGVVDDQIWSNSKFKLCLKVQNASDSNEMLKTPDAASITLPGRAYLQVGNNEIYELFQSAWSGANYYKDEDEQQEIDTTIYEINELGQYDILTEDLSGLEKQETLGKVETELEAIIAYLDNLVTEMNVAKLPQPWLPPLEEKITAPINNYLENWQGKKPRMEVEVGIVDQPHIQAQSPLALDISKDGHLAIISSPGFGKSTTLQTIVMGLARNLQPDQMHTYLLDFGTNGLLALRHLPHIADTIQIDEVEKISKLIRRLSAEMKMRKAKLSEYSVASLEQYEQASGEQLPYITIVIDNYDAIKDSDFNELQALNGQISREGASIGIHLIMSATSYSSFKTAMQANIKLKLALYMNDKSDVNALVGRSDFAIEETAGRGLIKLDQPTIFQIGLPQIGDNALEIIEAIKEESEVMKKFYKGPLPKPIPMVPEVLTYNEFVQIPSVQKSLLDLQLLPVGVDFEEVESVNWEFGKNNLIIGFAHQQEAEQYAAPLLTEILTKGHKIALFDVANSELYNLAKEVQVYAGDKESYKKSIESIEERFEDRVEEYNEYRQNESNPKPVAQYFADHYKIFVVLNNLKQLGDDIKSTEQNKLVPIIETGNNYGIVTMIISEETSVDKSYSEIGKACKKITSGIIDIKLGDQRVFKINRKTYGEVQLKPKEGYYINNGLDKKIKLYEK